MPKSIVNLTALVVVAEIEQIVETHYHYPYQNIFANSDLRQELMAYILTRVRNVHITVEAGEESRLQPETIPYLTEVKLQIEDYIHQGIRHILHKYGSLVSHGIEGNCGNLTTPRWFS
ncbi:MAG: hypothetical protein NW224_19675 [Leptolyngbyaceae cyanobacterium bins.302]|nr:hypothetical protein [Leptolyngbyaceae cyanobacterium bins.302]